MLRSSVSKKFVGICRDYSLINSKAIVSICNKAMIQSTQASSPRNPIYNFPVSGCMFFGVPDKGSDTVDTASKFLKLLATVFDVNRSTIEGLQVKSHKLADIAGQFRQIRHEHNIPVLSFYEKQEYSSTLGLVSRDLHISRSLNHLQHRICLRGISSMS